MHGIVTAQDPQRPVVRRSNDWTLREHEVVVSHWPNTAEIRRLLPHRSLNSIRSFAGKCNLRRQSHQWTDAETFLLKKLVRQGKSRKQIAHDLGMTPTQVQNRCQFLKLHAVAKPPTPTGNRLMDSIYQRAFELNMSRRELDEACGSGLQFRNWSLTRRISLKHIAQVVKVLDGELLPSWTPLASD